MPAARKEVSDAVYVYILHGGAIPAEFIEIILRRELHMSSADIEALSAKKLSELLAALQGESRGLRERSRRQTESLPAGG